MGRDARIVYGARCTWWDGIGEVATLPAGLPVCPSCGNVLLEVPDQETWDRSVELHAKEADDPAYPEFIRWLRGRCYPTAQEAREKFEEERLRELATTLVKKLDVALPKIDGIVGFQSLRQGSSAYDGPDVSEEVEELRRILKLPKPAAEPHEFYPEGYCETCKGSGEVPGGEGMRSYVHRMNPDMERHLWRDVCRDCRGTGGIGRPVATVGPTEDGEAILATKVLEGKE